MDGQGYSIRKSGGVTAPPEGSSVPGEKALELINRYTRRHFSAGELYTFPVVLCDNEIDRDGERFTAGALEKLAGLFPGKTGIFNHSGKAESQTARLYSCRVERDPARRTLAGEPYARLVGEAYLPRTEKNADFITELDGGIKKEVSVGCAVAKVTCSVCGADLKNGGCGHVRGQIYGGVRCCAVLDEPTDAYEWSFVAVPAQRAAGVRKCFSGRSGEEIEKSLRETDGEFSLTGEERRRLLERLDRLEEEAACGRAYRAKVRKDFLRFASLTKPEIPAEVLGRAADGMSLPDLQCFAESCRREAQKALPLEPQLAGGKKKAPGPDGNAPFRI